MHWKGDRVFVVNKIRTKKNEGPDTLKSWLMALCGFMISFTMSGIARATGIIYVDIIKVYGISRRQANAPFTLRNIMRRLAGPVVGIIGHKYGTRKITVIGCTLAVFGIALCSIAPNIFWLTVLWGGVHGLGVSFSNTLFPATINQHFVKYRATASGLALSGTCIASFVFPFTLEVFLEVYGLSGTFLMTAGILMNVIPISMLLKEPSWLRRSPEFKRYPGTRNPENINRQYEERRIVNEPIKTSSTVIAVEQIRNSPKTPSPSDTAMVPNGINNPVYMSSSQMLNSEKYEQLKNIVSETQTATVVERSEFEPSPVQEPSTSRSMLECLASVFRNPLFYMISMSFAMYAMLFDPLMTVLVDYTKDKGLDYDISKYLLTLLSVGDLFGRIGLGWITDKEYLTFAMYMLIIQFMQGVCFLLLPLLDAVEYLALVLVVYGVVSGSVYVMLPVLVARYLPREQTLALGCGNFVSGIVMLSLPSLIGFYRDFIGSYDGLFYVTGGLSALTSFLWLFEPCLLRMNSPELTGKVD